MHATQDHKLITCIVPKGTAPRVLEALKREHGIDTANYQFARGAGRMIALAERGVGEATEKEILSVLVPAGEAEAIFEYLYHEAGVAEPHGGMMFQQALEQATPFMLPELAQET